MVSDNKKQKTGNYRRIQRMAGLCLLPGLLSGMPAEAWHLPKWEFGLGAGVLRVPAYRGASGRKNIWLPVPYIAYRGERFRVDEEGMRGKLLQKNRVHLDFSVAGSLPVSSGGGARAGMPDLDPIAEIGPSLKFFLGQQGHRHKGWEQQWWVNIPLRAALSVGDPWVSHQGWVFSPYLNRVWVKGVAHARWRWSLAVGPVFASREYHEYFYTVSDRYANTGRSVYDATAGYSGSRMTLGLSVNSKKWFVGAFVRYDDLHGAVFDDSPLVEARSYLAAGVGVSRVFMQSGEHAPHAPHERAALE